jgi:glycosyltransferase involved in cell wall biosynthesis
MVNRTLPRAPDAEPSERRLLMVGNFLSASSSTRFVCEELAERLSDEGWSVVRTSNKVNRLARLLDMVATAWFERNSYEIAQVDVYSGTAFVWAEAVCWILRAARKPYVLTLHGGNLPAYARRFPTRVRQLLCSAAVVTTPSRFLGEEMKIYREDLHLLPNALDIGSYTYRLRDRVAPSLVWIRAFYEYYNPSLALRVLSTLSSRFPDVRLVMVGPDRGDGSLRACQKLAVDLQIEERVTFVGGVRKADVPKWIENADVFLNTTNVDNTPVSILEAMACGLCVVSTNVGGLPYLIEDRENGLMVPPDDATAMAAAIAELLTDRELAGRVSRNGRRTSERRDWSVILPVWKSLLSNVGVEAD